MTLSEFLIPFNVGWWAACLLSIFILIRGSKMKTCPTCHGESKVKDEVKDHWAEIRPQLAFFWGRIWRGGLVLVTAPVITASFLGLVRLAMLMINYPTIIKEIRPAELYGSSLMLERPSEALAFAAFVGVAGGLGLAVLLAFNLKWSTCSINGWCCPRHSAESTAKRKEDELAAAKQAVALKAAVAAQVAAAVQVTGHIAP